MCNIRHPRADLKSDSARTDLMNSTGGELVAKSVLSKWMFRGSWFYLQCSPTDAAGIVIGAVERYANGHGAWRPIDPELCAPSHPNLQEPLTEVSAMLRPKIFGAMPRDTLLYLRTYDDGNNDSIVMLTALIITNEGPED
jgi:hypothetical protein